MRYRGWILGILFVSALFLRCYGLGSVGLSEDEANKILAVESYRHGDFSANGEHPMLMKLLCTASVVISEKWNALIPALKIIPEAALRFPLALAGGLVVFAIYFLGRERFGVGVALIA